MLPSGDCNCTCPANYAGSRCELCQAHFFEHPLCYDNCTNVDFSCHGHGTNVSGEYPNCVCECKSNYNGTSCDTCAVGFAGYPNCYDDCSNALASCNSHATNVSQSPAGCVCNCYSNYDGPTCNRCAGGYGPYPACHEDCTNISVSCSSHTVAVSGAYPSCNCSCVLGYGDLKCGTCAPGFTGGNCSECTHGYVTTLSPCDSCIVGYGGYPYCHENCSSTTVSCNGNAYETYPNTTNSNQCVCRCYRGFAGPRCERCAEGFASYDSCIETCDSVSASCNSRALNVSKLPSGRCKCSCFANYTGNECESCEDGYGPYPNCVENCTSVNVSCSGHASAVTTATSGSCNCTCFPGFEGPRCTRCIDGYIGYPNCTDACTDPAVSCSGHASSVSGPPGKCLCQCSWGYALPLCSSCAAGFRGYPFCVEDCTDATVSCSGHALTVNGTSPPCGCTCEKGFVGDRCERCKVGYANYPHCNDNCTLTSVSCNDLAVTVEANGTNVSAAGCRCHCMKGYSGDACETCDHGYAGWPVCHDACTSTEVSCHGFATNVSGSYPNCLCGCITGYNGTTCGQCAEGYGGFPSCRDDCTVARVSCSEFASAILTSPPSHNCTCVCNPHYLNGTTCRECAEGYEDYPRCTEACTSTTVSCNRHAVNVSKKNDGSCECRCADNFDGPTCDRCALGYGDYPSCEDACIYPNVSCHGRGVNVTRLIDRSCFCGCPANYLGNQCEGCASGYGGPNCTEDCTDVLVSCRGPALSVSGTFPHCICDCNSTHLKGDLCEGCVEGYGPWPTCPDNCTNFNVSCNGVPCSLSLDNFGSCHCNCPPQYQGDRCESCSPGYGPYPGCKDACTNLDVSCGRGATAVTSNASNASQCICNCSKGYFGPKCDECASGYGGLHCTDDCTNTNVSCEGHAHSVTRINGTCNCSCIPRFAGPTCGECDAGYSKYPSCVDACTVVNVSCSAGRASSVALTDGKCVCACISVRHAGDQCQLCADGYGGSPFPDCDDDCTNINVSCHGHAKSLGGIVGSCLCECLDGYSNSTYCSSCSPHYSGYPNCTADPLGPPPFLRLMSQSRIPSRALRPSYSDLADRLIVFCIENTEMDAVHSAAASNTALWGKCLDLNAVAIKEDEANPFGFTKHKNVIWAPSSILQHNATCFSIELLCDADFDLLDDTDVSIFLNPNCTLGKREFTNSIKVTLEAEVLSVWVRALGTAVFLASSLTHFVALSTLSDSQMLTLLGTNGCARHEMRSAAYGSGWLLSIGTLWSKEDGPRLLPVLVMFVAVPVLHWLVTLVLSSRYRRSSRRVRSAGTRQFALLFGLRGVMEEHVEASVRFPGAMLMVLRALVAGVGFYSVRCLQSDDDTTIGAIGLGASLAFVFLFVVWVSSGGIATFTNYPSECFPAALPLISRHFLPRDHITPVYSEKKHGWFLKQNASVVAAAVEILFVMITSFGAAVQPSSRRGCVYQYAIMAVWMLAGGWLGFLRHRCTALASSKLAWPRPL